MFTTKIKSLTIQISTNHVLIQYIYVMIFFFENKKKIALDGLF